LWSNVGHWFGDFQLLLSAMEIGTVDEISPQISIFSFSEVVLLEEPGLACAASVRPSVRRGLFFGIARLCFGLLLRIPYPNKTNRKNRPNSLIHVSPYSFSSSVDETPGYVFRTDEQEVLLRSLYLTWPSSMSRDSLMLGPHTCVTAKGN
jgi:hypothetical protein